MWLTLKDDQLKNVLVNMDQVSKVTQYASDTVSVLHTTGGESITVGDSLSDIENMIIVEERRLADLTKTAR